MRSAKLDQGGVVRDDEDAAEGMCCRQRMKVVGVAVGGADEI